MYVIDASGLQYLTRDAYPDIYHDLDAYNRQANWVNSGAKQLTVNEVPAILGMLQNLDAMVSSVGGDDNAAMEVREEAGGLLAGVKYAMDNLNAPVATMGFSQNPHATYTEAQYFQ
jgi:hypothetical protein